MKSNNSNTDTMAQDAVKWWKELKYITTPYDLPNKSRISHKYYPNKMLHHLTTDEILYMYEIEHPQPKESTHITWWKGLNEEEKYKLCCKHFQGIPVESLMERSIKVMYHYENPQTTETEESYTAPDYLGLAKENETLKERIKELETKIEFLEIDIEELNNKCD